MNDNFYPVDNINNPRPFGRTRPLPGGAGDLYEHDGFGFYPGLATDTGSTGSQRCTGSGWHRDQPALYDALHADPGRHAQPRCQRPGHNLVSASRCHRHLGTTSGEPMEHRFCTSAIRMYAQLIFLDESTAFA